MTKNKKLIPNTNLFKRFITLQLSSFYFVSLNRFHKNDKGTWIINSEMVVQPKGERMKSKGMVLYMNRNTKTTNGYYYVDVTKDEDEGKPHDNEKKISG